MALVAERWGLIPELKSFTAHAKPVWGTCAGLIFLADRATGQKEGGQALLGGLDCLVQRNFFGAQINSFETQLPAPAALPADDSENGDFRAVFIRAPAIVEAGPQVEVLAEYQLSQEEAAAAGRERVAVAVRSGHLLATAFHPELTADVRWHKMFVDMVRQRQQLDSSAGTNGSAAGDMPAQQSAAVDDQHQHQQQEHSRRVAPAADLPVYEAQQRYVTEQIAKASR